MDVKILYKNWKGEIRIRSITPISIQYTSNEYHKDIQWIMYAKDIEKSAIRGFAMKDILHWWTNDNS